MSPEVDAILDDLRAWAEGLRRDAVHAGPAHITTPDRVAALADDVAHRVVAGLVAPIAESVERAAAAGDRTLPAAVRDLFGLP